MCEQVLIISRGRLVAFDTPENLEKLLSASGVTFCVEADKKSVKEILSDMKGLAGQKVIEAGGVCTVTADFAEGVESKTVCGRLTMAFAEKGLPVFEMRTKKVNLEDVFLELTEAGAAEEPHAVEKTQEESEAGKR